VISRLFVMNIVSLAITPWSARLLWN